MSKIYNFKTCVTDNLNFNGQTPSNCAINFVTNITKYGSSAGNVVTSPSGFPVYSNVQKTIEEAYANDDLLSGNVEAIGYGWQRWEVPRNIMATITARGGAGGHSLTNGAVVDQSNGTVISGSGCTGGRGAKLQGSIKLLKGDVLYIAVGIRGWCQRCVDWAGTGGGATCIYRKNPNGKYTFEPTGEKIDVLMIAAGGGGSFDTPTTNNTTHRGKDGNYVDGTNTNGGTGITAGGGAGLTGNGSGNKYSYNLLSKSIANGTAWASQYSSAFPGGGTNYNGGGGGAGYSGGSTNDQMGGYGGASYINSDYVTEVFRGYEDVSLNPYSIPGEVVIEAKGRDVDEYILIKDNDGNKYYNPATDMWELIPNQGTLTPDDYETYGKAPEIKNINGINGDKVKFLVSSPYPDKEIGIEGLVNKQVIKSNFEIDITSVQTIKSWNILGRHNSAELKVAISFDHGSTYKGLVNNTWTDIDMTDKEDIYNKSISVDDLNTIPSEKWKELSPTSIKIAFMVHQTSYYIRPILTGIELVCDLLGAWTKAIHGIDYDYRYPTPEACIVTINQDGDYKINYLDRIDNN